MARRRRICWGSTGGWRRSAGISAGFNDVDRQLGLSRSEIAKQPTAAPPLTPRTNLTPTYT